MKKTILLISLLGWQILGLMCLAQENEPFAYLEKLVIQGDNWVSIKYNQGVSELINKGLTEIDKSKPVYSNLSQIEWDLEHDHYLIKTKLDNRTQDEYFITYSPGPSEDPEFFIYNINDPVKPIYHFNTNHLILPGNGFIYTVGRSGQYFNKRRKYEFEGNSIIEVKQPYYYVGLETTTTEAITLYATTALEKEIAKLPEGYGLEVLLSAYDEDGNESLYLIRTEFGLTGWYKIKHWMNTGIKGLFYLGD